MCLQAVGCKIRFALGGNLVTGCFLQRNCSFQGNYFQNQKRKHHFDLIDVTTVKFN